MLPCHILDFRERYVGTVQRVGALAIAGQASVNRGQFRPSSRFRDSLQQGDRVDVAYSAPIVTRGQGAADIETATSPETA